MRPSRCASASGNCRRSTAFGSRRRPTATFTCCACCARWASLVDAVSLGEIERALRAGYVPGSAAHEIVFTADMIDEATLARVAALGIPVNCGSPDMLRSTGQRGPRPSGLAPDQSGLRSRSQPQDQHRWTIEQARHLARRARGHALRLVDAHGLSLVGLHMHIGSGVDYTHLHRVCDSMLDAVRRLDRPLQAISAGGGLSVPYRSGEPEIDTPQYFAAWNEDPAARPSGSSGGKVRLEIEPGRYLTGQCRACLLPRCARSRRWPTITSC